MSPMPQTTGPSGRKKPIGHRSSAIGDAAKPPAALGHESKNTAGPEGAKKNGEPLAGWKCAPLSELCDRITKGSSPNWQGFEYCENGIIFVRSQNVGWGELKLDEVAHLSVAFNEKEKKSVLKVNDVLLNLVGASIGRACVATSEVDGGNVNQAVAVIRVRPEALVPKFLVHFLVSPLAQARIHSEKVDVARANFSLEDTRSLSIPVPPLPDQHRIVAEIEKQFTRLEAGVAALRRVQANLKRYRAAVLKAACEGRLVPREAELARVGRVPPRGVRPNAKNAQSGDAAYNDAPYETGEQLLQRILADRRKSWTGRRKYKEPAAPNTANLPPLPEGWTWATPDQLSDSADNAICAGPFGTIFKARDFRPTGVPIIFLRHVAPGRYLTHKPGFMDTAKWEALFRPYSVFGGELLITKLGEPPGICGIYPRGIGPAMVTPDVMKMTPNPAAALALFLMHYFNSQTARDFATGVAFGTTRLRLTLPIFREMPVPLPPLAEQARIVAEVERRLSVVEELEAVVSTNLHRASRLRQSILQNAFGGKL
jgi:type I restriction enzyme, S subunit